jgi:hypothetical protein
MTLRTLGGGGAPGHGWQRQHVLNPLLLGVEAIWGSGYQATSLLRCLSGLKFPGQPGVWLRVHIPPWCPVGAVGAGEGPEGLTGVMLGNASRHGPSRAFSRSWLMSMLTLCAFLSEGLSDWVLCAQGRSISVRHPGACKALSGIPDLHPLHARRSPVVTVTHVPKLHPENSGVEGQSHLWLRPAPHTP